MSHRNLDRTEWHEPSRRQRSWSQAGRSTRIATTMLLSSTKATELSGPFRAAVPPPSARSPRIRSSLRGVFAVRGSGPTGVALALPDPERRQQSRAGRPTAGMNAECRWRATQEVCVRNRRSGMVSRLVIGLALGACVISVRPAAAQSTIFNIPSTDTVAPGKVYFELDVLPQFPRADFGSWTVVAPRVVFGVTP